MQEPVNGNNTKEYIFWIFGIWGEEKKIKIQFWNVADLQYKKRGFLRVSKKIIWCCGVDWNRRCYGSRRIEGATRSRRYEERRKPGEILILAGRGDKMKFWLKSRKRNWW